MYCDAIGQRFHYCIGVNRIGAVMVTIHGTIKIFVFDFVVACRNCVFPKQFVRGIGFFHNLVVEIHSINVCTRIEIRIVNIHFLRNAGDWNGPGNFFQVVQLFDQRFVKFRVALLKPANLPIFVVIRIHFSQFFVSIQMDVNASHNGPCPFVVWYRRQEIVH